MFWKVLCGEVLPPPPPPRFGFGVCGCRDGSPACFRPGWNGTGAGANRGGTSAVAGARARCSIVDSIDRVWNDGLRSAANLFVLKKVKLFQ